MRSATTHDRETSRSRLGLGLLALVLSSAGCGGGTEPPSATQTTPPSTVPPWTELPVPEMPPAALTIRDGVFEVAAVCIDVERSGTPIDMTGIIDTITGWLDRLDVDVVEQACDARFVLGYEADRQSAEYFNVGTCWPGWTIRSTATLTRGDHERTWTDFATYSIPAAVEACTNRTSTIEFDDRSPGFQWSDVTYDEAFTRSFGPAGELVAAADVRSSHADPNWLTDDALPALIWWYVENGRDARDFIRLNRLAEQPTAASILAPLVPYLVDDLADGYRPGSSVANLLEQITGIAAPETDDVNAIQHVYWEWWETRGE